MLKKKIYSTRAEQIMTDVEVTAGPGDPISEALGKMKKYGLEELPVVEKDKLRGVITFRTLARRRKMPISAQVKSFMISPPKVKTNDRLPAIVERLITRDFTSLPVTRRSTVMGIISRRNIIDVIRNEPEMKSMSVETVMNFGPTTLSGDMGIKKALNLMELTREDSCAVLDDKGDFIGVVSHSDMVPFLQMHPSKPQHGDFHGEKVHRDRKISSLASMPETLDIGASIGEAIDLMDRLEMSVVYVTEGKELIGSVGEVDLIEVFLRGQTSRGPLVQIAGIEDAKLMDASELKSLIDRHLAKIGRISDVRKVTVRIRHHHHDRDDTKYTVNVKLTTSKDVVSRESYDWDLDKAITGAFSVIEKHLKKEHDKRRFR